MLLAAGGRAPLLHRTELSLAMGETVCFVVWISDGVLCFVLCSQVSRSLLPTPEISQASSEKGILPLNPVIVILELS